MNIFRGRQVMVSSFVIPTQMHPLFVVSSSTYSTLDATAKYPCLTLPPPPKSSYVPPTHFLGILLFL